MLDAPTDIAALAIGVTQGKRGSLATALNLLDDRRAESRGAAAELLAALWEQPQANNARLIGLTGPPGVGKSSLTAALIEYWRSIDFRVGVLAVDPSSPISGGALLGDRLRMKTTQEDDGVFVRSLSSRGEFGGLSSEVWPMSVVMLSCFDVVIIETVGVGQREVDIAQVCDTTCFVAQPGSGDSVQFIKAGVLEVPHIVVVNKADMGAVATRTLSEMQAAMTREHPEGDWQVPVLSTSAVRGDGIEELANTIEERHKQLVQKGELQGRRRRYQANWVVKRLENEFGRHGIEQLGGSARLLSQLQNQTAGLFAQYDILRAQLTGPPLIRPQG